MIENGRLTWRLINDPRVSSLVKVGIPLFIAIYLFSPIDFIPDFIPVLGQLDDIGVLLFGMSLIMRFSPQYVVDEHRQSLGISGQLSGRGSQPTSYTQATKSKQPGEPTRPIDGEFTVVPPK